MSQASIPVDIFNPGQVFACLGFMEAAEVLLGDVECGFDWRDRSKPLFHLRANGERNPFEVVLEFLANATVSAISADPEVTAKKWNISTNISDEIFPFLPPDSPAALPTLISSNNKSILLAHYGEHDCDNVKFWGGAGGYPGSALAQDGINLIKKVKLLSIINDPLNFSALQSSSFRFDWRKDYTAIDIGFSVNAHKNIKMLGYPIVDVLAAVGMTNSRPNRIGPLHYEYGLLALSEERNLHLPILARAMLGSENGFCKNLRRNFEFFLIWSGKEGYSRSITEVREKFTP